MHTSSRSDHRSRTLSERANKMRHAPTPSEARLFAAVRGRRLGVAFRRQVPVLGKYIVDLLAPEVRLVVEVDGGYHGARRDADARRDRALARAGYRVLRLDTELVMRDSPAAVERVREAIAGPSGARWVMSGEDRAFRGGAPARCRFAGKRSWTTSKPRAWTSCSTSGRWFAVECLSVEMRR